MQKKSASQKSIMKNYKSSFAIIITAAILSSCTPSVPKHINNICKIYQQRPTWFWASEKVQKKWGIPMSVQMAIIYQESRFKASARPPRKKLLGFIPWRRPTSADGYAQATKPTWDRYKKSSKNHHASRDDFADAADFIGWYSREAKRIAGILPGQAHLLYLAYHEGVGGYLKKSYRKKPWLVKLSHKVRQRSETYHKQLIRCISKLPQKPWWHFW